MLALGSAILIQFWKWSQEKFNARIDEFCKLILEAADTGAEYWTNKKALNEPDKRALIELLETKIDGYQKKVELFRVVVQPRIKLRDRDRLVDLLVDFFDALTGASFGANVRQADTARAKLVYVTAADVVAHLRSLSPSPSLYFVFVAAALVAAAYILFH